MPKKNKVTFSDTVEIFGQDEPESHRSKIWKRLKKTFRYLFFCFLLYCVYKFKFLKCVKR